jgi:hypothetical protein
MKTVRGGAATVATKTRAASLLHLCPVPSETPAGYQPRRDTTLFLRLLRRRRALSVAGGRPRETVRDRPDDGYF